MAFAMTVQGPASAAIKGPMFTGLPVASFSLADQTATTAAQNCVVGCRTFRAVIYAKTVVLGGTTTAGSGPIFSMEVADNSGMSTNLTCIARVQILNVANATEVQCYELRGIVPVALKQYVRVVLDTSLMGSGSPAVTFDTLIDAT